MTGSRWLDSALLQGTWLVVVGGAAKDNAWPGIALVAALVAWVQWRSDDGRALLTGVLSVSALGTALDSAQSALGLVRFSGSFHPLLCPLWVTALWAHLALLLRGPLGVLRGRATAAALLGGLAGPLAYLGGVEIGAATLSPSRHLSLLALAVEWAVALPLAAHLVPATVAAPLLPPTTASP